MIRFSEVTLGRVILQVDVGANHISESAKYGGAM